MTAVMVSFAPAIYCCLRLCYTSIAPVTYCCWCLCCRCRVSLGVSFVTVVMMSIALVTYYCLCLCCHCCVKRQCPYVFCMTAVLGERGERDRIVSDNAHVKAHGRSHVNLNFSISSEGNLDYLLPSSVKKRDYVADKQEGARSVFSTMNVVYVHALFFKRKKICGTVPSAAGFLPIKATLQASSTTSEVVGL